MVLKPDNFTEQAREVLAKSQEVKRRYRHGQWDVEHMLMAVLEQDSGVPAEILKGLGAPVDAMRARLDELMRQGPKTAHESAQVYVAPRAARALERAKDKADRRSPSIASTSRRTPRWSGASSRYW